MIFANRVDHLRSKIIIGEKKEKESVINLSNSCIDRLTGEEEDLRLDLSKDSSEKEWMMKLKCLDDAHSNTYGLTINCFEELIKQVESQIEPIRPLVCSSDEVIQCLKKNPCCGIKCRPVMEKYIDCIETYRINIIKEQIENELKEKRKEDQDIVEEFLKSPPVD
ncbi:uncharacterized protein LOC143202511 [Rhynchophorus ferrugineus]|uniref:uncharacterized protein LOC143202511 n=1 Tax=Rhynchophorus ferrugineus TaxID=354439 RepID=UPI003FCC5CD9